MKLKIRLFAVSLFLLTNFFALFKRSLNVNVDFRTSEPVLAVMLSRAALFEQIPYSGLTFGFLSMAPLEYIKTKVNVIKNC